MSVQTAVGGLNNVFAKDGLSFSFKERHQMGFLLQAQVQAGTGKPDNRRWNQADLVMDFSDV